MRYLDGDTIDLCREAIRNGQSVDAVAGWLHLDSGLLGRLLGLPTSQPAAVDTDQSSDLWAADRAHDQL